MTYSPKTADLDHDGTNVGFYGVAPAARPAAYTQTYATATRTHADATSADLTDSTGVAGGSINTTIEALTSGTVTGSDLCNATTISNRFDTANKNFADLADQFNKLRADLLNLKQVVNQVIDDDQTLGLKQ